MKEKIVKVAAGELAYTTFTVTNLDSWGVDFTYSASDHQDAFNQFCYDLDLDTISLPCCTTVPMSCTGSIRYMMTRQRLAVLW